MNLSKKVKVTMVKAGQASAGTEVDSASVDMQGWEGVIFIGTIATVHASNKAHAAQSSDDIAFDDLEGTAVSPDVNGDSFLIDVYRPTDRYVRCEVIRSGANTATGDIYAIQYGPRSMPTTHGATVDAEAHVSPAEGTA